MGINKVNHIKDNLLNMIFNYLWLIYKVYTNTCINTVNNIRL